MSQEPPNCYLSNLIKSEDPAEYAKRASEGMMLGYPVSIGGETHRKDNGIGYHSTIKVFDKEKDHGHKVHNLAQHMSLNPPDAKNTQIEPSTFKDRNGNEVFVIKLRGNSADKLKEHHGKFTGMGDPESYEFQPHVSVPKDIHDRIKASGAKTAHEAGISFGSAELKQGPKTIKTYHHQPDANEPRVPDEGDITAKVPYEPQMKKLAAGEKEFLCSFHKSELPLEKGALKNAGIALGMAGALAGGTHTADAKGRVPASVQHTQTKAPSYDHGKMLRAIASVESSGGKNTNHAAGGGPIHGAEHAYGKYGLMPETIRETIKGHKDLSGKHGKALALKGDQFHRYMNDNKGLEDTVADRHLTHMEHKLGQNPDLLSYGWLNGTQGALNAKNKKQDISKHWHVSKVRDAYGKEK